MTGTTGHAQTGQDYKDYFLVGQFGEVCTMCEVTVLCEAGESVPTYDAIPDDGDFVLYHLRTRTFWSQVSTIWEVFITNFTTESIEQRGHVRPAIAYSVDDGVWQAPREIEARLILNPGVIHLDGRKIDRTNQQWLSSTSDASLGYCQRVALWESLEIISARSPAAR